MSRYVDANQNVEDTTGASAPQMNAATQPNVDPTGAPNSKGSAITNLAITNGSGQTIANWSNPA